MLCPQTWVAGRRACVFCAGYWFPIARYCWRLVGWAKAPGRAAPSAAPTATPTRPATHRKLPPHLNRPRNRDSPSGGASSSWPPIAGSFHPCGRAEGFALVDQTDGVLRREFAGEKDADGADQALKLYIEAYGEREIDRPANKNRGYLHAGRSAVRGAPDGRTRPHDLTATEFLSPLAVRAVLERRGHRSSIALASSDEPRKSPSPRHRLGTPKAPSSCPGANTADPQGRIA